MTKLISVAIDYLFPPKCLICGSRELYRLGYFLCKNCFDSISFISHPFCTRCGKPFFTESIRGHVCGDCLIQEPYFYLVRSLGRYEGTLEKIIHHLKYKQKFTMGNLLALLLENIPSDGISFGSYDLFIPVPLHIKRLRQRGFNQSVILGKILNKKYRVPLKTMVLQRSVYTLPQVNLPVKERKLNVRNAFRVKDHRLIQGKKVLILDDVFTTGATLNECARVLKKFGASRVDGFVIARAA